MELDNFATWLEINLETLENNYRILQETIGTPVMPVVKANAYGHGLEEVARTLEKAGAQWCGVARIEEALLLRNAGNRMRILVLGYTAPQRIKEAILNSISLTVYDPIVVRAYAQQASSLNQRLDVQVKVDTGMGRLGIPTENALEFILQVKDLKEFNLQGIFTHFACADEPKKPYTQQQLDKFYRILEEIQRRGIRPELIHSANSAAALNFPLSRFDLVRCGLALYGISPSRETNLPEGIKPALSWKTRLISLKQITSGQGISYGFQYFTKKAEKIGVIAAGYGDGLRRQSGNNVLLHGKRVSVVGNVCMDQCMLQLDQVPNARVGDEVVLIGKQGEEEITMMEIAQNWNTISYEVMCGMAARMPREYIH
jgi:alanine racemase